MGEVVERAHVLDRVEVESARERGKSVEETPLVGREQFERPLYEIAQTAMALAHSELGLTIERLFAVMSWQPAAIAGIGDRHGGPVVAGRIANLCVFDPSIEWIVRGDAMASKSRNTPFEGRALRGKIRHTIYQGQPVVEDSEAQR